MLLLSNFPALRGYARQMKLVKFVFMRTVRVQHIGVWMVCRRVPLRLQYFSVQFSSFSVILEQNSRHSFDEKSTALLASSFGTGQHLNKCGSA